MANYLGTLQEWLTVIYLLWDEVYIFQKYILTLHLYKRSGRHILREVRAAVISKVIPSKWWKHLNLSNTISNLYNPLVATLPFKFPHILALSQPCFLVFAPLISTGIYFLYSNAKRKKIISDRVFQEKSRRRELMDSLFWLVAWCPLALLCVLGCHLSTQRQI